MLTKAHRDLYVGGHSGSIAIFLRGVLYRSTLLFRGGSLELAMSVVAVEAPSIADMEAFKQWNPVFKVKREEFQR